MRSFSGWRPLLWALILGCCLNAAVAAPLPPNRFENRRREMARVFHPQASQAGLLALGEPLLVLSQTLGAVVVIGGLLMRLRRDEAQLESLASMMLKVFFIASLPLWRTMTLEVAETSAGLLGPRSVPSVTLETAASGGGDPLQSSPLLDDLWRLFEQWSLEGSPLQDSVEGGWRPRESGGDAQLTKGWNWAKPPVLASTEPGEVAWAVAGNVERASLLQSLLLGNAAGVQTACAALYIAETARLIVFHAGCALAPFCIAALGTYSLGTPALRALLGLAGVAFWPLPWAALHVGTRAFCSGLLQTADWACSSAMFPKQAAGLGQTLALSAPYLSWSLLLSLSVMTLCLCVWICLGLLAGPWLLNRMLGSGARWLSGITPQSQADSGKRDG